MSKPAPLLCVLRGLCANQLPNTGPKPSRPQFRAEFAESAEALRRCSAENDDTRPKFPYPPPMTTLQITLPDDLARDAAKAGLLAPEVYADWLRAQLKKQAVDRLFESMARMDAIDDGQPPMSPEDVAEEIRIMRAERRAAASR